MAVLEKTKPAMADLLKAAKKASDRSGLSSATKKYFPRADIPKPNPDEFEAPFEPQVRTTELAADVLDSAQGATAIAPKVASVLSVAPSATTVSALGAVNTGLQKANVIGNAALTGIDLARVAFLPEYRDALKQEAQRIAASNNRGLKGFATDSYEMLKYISGRPMSGGRVFWDAMNQLHTDKVNAELRTETAKRQADRMLARLNFEERMRNGELTPKMDTLRSQRAISK